MATTATTHMKAAVYAAPNTLEVQLRPLPTLVSPTDAILRMQHTSICGTDLHILAGELPTCPPGRILGHEGVGVIASLGSAIPPSLLNRGDRVLISPISACGSCTPCRKGLHSHCTMGGWLLGHTIDGTQAEYVRIPHAARSLYKLPPGTDGPAAVLVSDVFPTAYECAVERANLSLGDEVVILGPGPIGLAALMLVRRLAAPKRVVVIGRGGFRLDMARRLGADLALSSLGIGMNGYKPASGPESGSDSDSDANADVDADSGPGLGVNRGEAGAKETGEEAWVRKALGVDVSSGQGGFDAVLEAVGAPQTLALAQLLVAPAGSIASLGIVGEPVSLHLERLWNRNISLTTRLLDGASTPALLDMVHQGIFDPSVLVSHRFSFDDVQQAYAVFRAASQHNALKVVISFDIADN